jgi:hypothetical protein
MVDFGLRWAQGKGFGYWSRARPADKVRDLIDFYGVKKWGWVIYRCTYGDDAAWHQFIERLHAYHTEEVLGDRFNAEDLVPSYDWIVQEDPATLDGATKDEVRRRFKQLRTSLIEAEVPSDLEHDKIVTLAAESPRYNFCIHVGAEALESVLREGFTYTTATNPTTSHVTLVRADGFWEMPDFDRFDWAKHEAEKEAEKTQGRESSDGTIEEDGDDDDEDDYEDDEYDDHEAEIEGSRLHDVGWMKVRADSLVHAYSVLQKVVMWDRLYKRPPQVMEC